MKNISANFGEGKYAVFGTMVFCGKDVNLSFAGGTKPHIGAISLAIYEPVRDSATVSTITVYEHRDDRLAARCAKDVATALKCTAVVSVGIHIDDAAPKELEILIHNFNKCYQLLIEKLDLPI